MELKVHWYTSDVPYVMPKEILQSEILSRLIAPPWFKIYSSFRHGKYMTQIIPHADPSMMSWFEHTEDNILYIYKGTGWSSEKLLGKLNCDSQVKFYFIVDLLQEMELSRDA